MKRVTLILVVILFTAISILSASADDSRFDFSFKTVEDKRTGLTWMRDAGQDRLDWAGTLDLLKKLNKKEYAGYNDWRLPSRGELDTLVVYAIRANYFGGAEAPSPYKLFNQLGYEDTQNYWYWTASPFEDSSTYAWVISMHNGHSRGESKDNSHNVWPVRGGK